MPPTSSSADLQRKLPSAPTREKRRGKRGSQQKEIQQPAPKAATGTLSALARPFTTPPQRPGGGSFSSTNKSTRKGMDASFLLNFHAPERTVDPGYKPVRRRGPVVLFNKDRFIQANFRFVVAEGDYSVNLAVADKMVEWDVIREVHVAHNSAYNCPICLEPPCAARVTKCGHVYCWPCLQRFFVVCGKPYGPCPICTDIMTKNSGSLKPAVVHTVEPVATNDTIAFHLMRLEKGAVTAFRMSSLAANSHTQSLHANGCPDHTHPDVAFSKLSIAQDPSVISGRERHELTEALEVAISCGEQELVHHIQACLRELDQQDAADANASVNIDDEVSTPTKNTGFSPTTPSSLDNVSFPPPLTASRPSSVSRSNTRARWWADGMLHEACASDEEHFDEDDHEHEGHSVIDDDDIGSLAEWHGEHDDHDHEELGPPLKNDYGDAMAAVSSGGKEAYSSTPQRRFESVDGVYYFYQAADGQRIFLHPLNMKCLLEEYGGYVKLPHVLDGKVIEIERFAQSEDLRKRYRFLEHLPLSGEFIFAEVDVSPLVAKETLHLYSNQIKARSDGRKQRERKEAQARARAEREEKRKRNSRTAPLPNDLFTGPTLAAAAAAAAYNAGMDDEMIENLLLSEAFPSPSLSHQTGSPGTVGFGSPPGQSWRELVCNKTQAIAPEQFPSLGDSAFPSLGKPAMSTPPSARSALGVSPPVASSGWGKRTPVVNTSGVKGVVAGSRVAGKGSAEMFEMDDVEDEALTEEERLKRIQDASDRAWEAGLAAATQNPDAPAAGGKKSRKNQKVLLSW